LEALIEFFSQTEATSGSGKNLSLRVGVAAKEVDAIGPNQQSLWTLQNKAEIQKSKRWALKHLC
jgi:hypothetical protein